MKATYTEDRPLVLTIAGSDSSAGAGIQADMKAALALGVYPLTAVTCVVSELPGQVRAVGEVPLSLVLDQVELLLGAYPLRALKTGMLYSPEIVEGVAALLAGRGLSLVIDPVMIASSGDSLMLESSLRAYEEKLFPLATLITPNLDEAEALLGQSIEGEEELKAAAHALVEKYQVAFLVKGGHLAAGAERLDYLVMVGGETHEWRSPYVEEVNTHGTGCTYSAAIASGLAQGKSLPEAVGQAHALLSFAIQNPLCWKTQGGILEALQVLP